MLRRPSLIALAALAVSCSNDSSSKERVFPKGFLFGAAVAGFQVDMGCPTVKPEECEDQKSDWYQWITDARILEKPAAVNFVGGPPSTGPGFYELFPQDFARAKNELKLGSVRLSIEWSRIFPESTVGVEGYEALKQHASAAGVDYYHRQFAEMKKLGLVPLVTLNHYTLPLWIHDGVDCHFNFPNKLNDCPKKGWLDPQTITEIAKYAGFVAKEFGGEIDLWATENEPLAIPLSGYIQAGADRTNPPGLTLKAKEAKYVTMALIKAHARMYDAVKANDTIDVDGDGKASQVGLVGNLVVVQPAGNSDEDLQNAKNINYLYNQLFLDATIKGDFDENAEGEQAQKHDASLAGRMDYLGVNYYTRLTLAGLEKSALPDFSPLLTIDPTSDKNLFYETYTRGIYEVVKFASDRYKLPIYITEAGVTTEDKTAKQPQAMVEYLQWLHKAIEEGADVRGFFWWSLTDNYEWNHGMSADMQFGLYAIDPKDSQKKRTIREAGTIYSGIAGGGKVSDELVTKYPIQ